MFFEEFVNVIVFYHVNDESDIWAQNPLPSTALSPKLLPKLNGGSNSYKSYHFLKECNENVRMHICKLL